MNQHDLFDQEIIVDNFAGGGGASVGIEQALGRPIDIAVNHDAEAIALHEVNHPHTKHYHSDVWEVDPMEAVGGKSVGLAWFSPDCKHFSKAKGGRPVSKRIRGLAWVVTRWAEAVRPRVIMLENVEEFQTWGPVLSNGFPCPRRRGQTFRRWVRKLEKIGYEVQWRELKACDFGAPTTRKRLFLIARCDGRPIVWPDPSHTEANYRPAAECLDFSIPVQSIFGRKRELAENTKARIAKGIERYVVNARQPFVVAVGDEPAVPWFVPRFGERPGQEPRTLSVERPMPTITPTQNGASLVTAFLAQHNTGMVGHDCREPLSTISSKGAQQQVVTSHLLTLRNNCHGQDLRRPMPAVTAGGNHLGEVRAFLTKYYGKSCGQPLQEPLHTVRTKDSFGLVTVAGVDYRMCDIGMRMLRPSELYAAQGFPSDYRIEEDINGQRFTRTAQARMVGNSVAPPVARALVEANVVTHVQDSEIRMAAG